MRSRIVKYGVAMVVCMLTAFAGAQEKEEAEGEAEKISLAEARSTISEAIENPEVMTETMKKLTPQDQVTYVAEVNAAIAKMPDSNKELKALKASSALNVNKAALKGAAQGNMANVLAEVFATAPVETLGVISESFASDLFNRDADPSTTYTDAQYTAIAEAVVKKIADRTASSEDNGVRNAFGMMMMVNATNGSVENLADTLSTAVDLPTDIREAAKTELAKTDAARAESSSATADASTSTSTTTTTTGDDRAYESIMVYTSDVEKTSADPALSLQLAGPQMLDAMLSDVAAGVLVNNEAATPILDNAFGGFGENVVYNNDAKPASTASDSTEPSKQADESVAPWVPTYQWQN